MMMNSPPTIACDYCFLGDATAAAAELPILVCKDRWSKTIWAYPCPSKGVDHGHGWTCLLNAVQETGYKEWCLRVTKSLVSKLCLSA